MRAKFKVLADALLALDTWELRELCNTLMQNFPIILDDDLYDGVSEELPHAMLDFAHENSVPFTEPNASEHEDRVDTEIARKALADIAANPASLLRGKRLARRLSRYLTQEPL